jgi:hypothetical protein
MPIAVEIDESILQPRLIILPPYAIDSRRSLTLESVETRVSGSNGTENSLKDPPPYPGRERACDKCGGDSGAPDSDAFRAMSRLACHVS